MIRFENVTKRYPNGTTAVSELSFEVAEGEIVTLVGPSGCGKTTTMKMVNRHIEPTSGRIFLDGADISEVDPVQLRRRIGYVIQQVGLFPHRTVLQNTATVPRLLGWSKKRCRARAAELLEMVGLEPAVYGDRYPDQLSGGQRQRVGVARALAADPPVLLMDEPFGAVDPLVRERLQNEFLRLQSTLRKTVLLVTHDIEEAVRLGDRIAVYGEGSVEQFDPPAKVLGAPATPYVADFVGADRGLKRLAVTPIEVGDLEQPPVVNLADRLDVATARMCAEGAPWAVVLDDTGELHGWIAAQPADDEREQREASRAAPTVREMPTTRARTGVGTGPEIADTVGTADGADGAEGTGDSGRPERAGGAGRFERAGGAGRAEGSDDIENTGTTESKENTGIGENTAATGTTGVTGVTGVTGTSGKPAGSENAEDSQDAAGSEHATRETAHGAGATVGDHARRMEAWLPLGAPLKQAFSTMLQYDAGWIAVVDSETEGHFLGVLTPARLHEALRRSVDADERDIARAEVQLTSVTAVGG